MPNIHRMNLNYLLNAEYYNTLTHRHFQFCNRALAERQFSIGTTVNSEKIPFSEPKQSFLLKTLYPGLLVGLGNAHEAGLGVDGNDEEGAEIKLGFTLDFVTGLPKIPGSTVKGILHSTFENHSEYVAGLLKINDKEEFESLKKSIFSEGKKKVVFFDAIPVKPGKANRLLSLENITPHLEPLKGPNPITLLKVIPNVEFLFRFDFKGFKNYDLKNLFKTILCDLGVGAKTNTGFGTMMEAQRVGETLYHLVCEEENLFHLRMQAINVPVANLVKPIVNELGKPVCMTEGCNNPVGKKQDGTYYLYCSTCAQKFNSRKAK